MPHETFPFQRLVKLGREDYGTHISAHSTSHFPHHTPHCVHTPHFILPTCHAKCTFTTSKTAPFAALPRRTATMRLATKKRATSRNQSPTPRPPTKNSKNPSLRIRETESHFFPCESFFGSQSNFRPQTCSVDPVRFPPVFAFLMAMA